MHSTAVVASAPVLCLCLFAPHPGKGRDIPRQKLCCCCCCCTCLHSYVQVVLFFLLSTPCRWPQHGSSSLAERTLPAIDTGTAATTADADAGTTTSSSAKQPVQHGFGPYMACKGHFSGRVLTIPASLWRPEDALQEFATANVGQEAVATCWHASCKRGILKLVAEHGAPAAAGTAGRKVCMTVDCCSGGREECEKLQDCTAYCTNPQAVGWAMLQEYCRKVACSKHRFTMSVLWTLPPLGACGDMQVRIPLQGCTISVVMECLAGRSMWWRKGPLLISRPVESEPLLHGETSFYMFAEHAAAKEQWLLALQWASSSRGTGSQQHQQQDKPQHLHQLYAAFCSQMRATLDMQMTGSKSMLLGPGEI